MTHFYTAKAVDDAAIVFANHTLDLDELPFRDPEGEEPPSGKFQAPDGIPKGQIERFLANVIKDHALEMRNHTILLRLSDTGEVVFWDVPNLSCC